MSDLDPERGRGTKYIRDVLVGATGALLAMLIFWLAGALDRRITEADRVRIAEELTADSAFFELMADTIQGDTRFKGAKGEQGERGPEGLPGPAGDAALDFVRFTNTTGGNETRTTSLGPHFACFLTASNESTKGGSACEVWREDGAWKLRSAWANCKAGCIDLR